MSTPARPPMDTRIALILLTVKHHSPVLSAAGEKAIRNVVRIALLETDRDARHRCAEAVDNLAPSSLADEMVLSRASAACTNATNQH